MQMSYSPTRVRNVRSFPEQAAYWKREIGSTPPELPIRLDHPRPPVQSFMRSTETITLEAGLLTALRALEERAAAPLGTVLLAAFQLLLLQHTGQEDIIVGSVSTDSILPDAPDTPFSNPIALRTNLDGNPSVRELLERVAQTLAAAAAHRDYPFEDVAAFVGTSYNFSKMPIFQTMFIVCDMPNGIGDTPATHEALADLGFALAQCDLVVTATPDQDELRVDCAYNAELFEPITIVNLLQQYHSVLERITVELDTPILTLSTTPQTEPAEFIDAFNDSLDDD